MVASGGGDDVADYRCGVKGKKCERDFIYQSDGSHLRQNGRQKTSEMEWTLVFIKKKPI